MTKLYELIAHLEHIAPLKHQESYDNAGLIVGDREMDITGVTVCLDSTEAVIDDAIRRGDNVVVAHHPIVFSGLKKFTGSDYIEKCIIKAIKNDIAIYAIHTNLDNVLEKGVNQKIGNKLGLLNQEILVAKDEKDPTIGAGIIGFLEAPIKAIDFLTFVKKEMKTDCVKYTEFHKENVQKVAICGGSGSFLLEEAMRKNCDVFITGDFKYHQFFDANQKIIIADIGHYESEQFTIELLVEIISDNFSNFAAHYTKVNTNPVKYL